MYGISNLASDTARYLNQRDRAARRKQARNRRSDEIRESYTWRDIENAMADAPDAQKELFWSQFLPFVLTDARFVRGLAKDNIGAAVHDAVTLAIEEQIDREIKQEQNVQEAQHDYQAG